MLTNVVVCAVGGIEPTKLLPAFAEKLGAIKSNAKPVAPVKAHSGNREMTWDLDARHLVLTWPIPTLDHADYPALLLAAQWLNMQFFGDEGLKQLTGMTLAGVDLTTPEGNFFFVSASLRPDATFAAVREKIDRHLQPLTSGEGDLSLAPMIGKQFAESLTTLPDLATMKGQLPPNVTPAMLELNIGLQWGMNEFRYGAQKAALARKLNSENIEKVQGAARRNLSTNECSVTTIRPF